ncbi:GGDEF domain-containing protein [Sphingobium sufflavum]|uniref:GGDEF domain-containing protein n=1 Tax=Sphingobium sufflavum TaxID=1129547 RepID=UPI001F320824|nr:GGDEF domain-containing protein [Sphingobium sufflavum]
MRTLSCGGALLGTDDEQENQERELAALRKEVAMLRLVNAELERVVVRDTLTPLYNRRYYISAVNERISRASRYESRAVAIIIDIDHMKRINDAHGHPAGDFALMHLAQLLSDTVRTCDVAARIGGDEFALILDELDEAQARTKIAALTKLVRDTPCRFGGATLPVSASFGLTAIRADDSDADVMARADQAMYDQKRLRRFGR